MSDLTIRQLRARLSDAPDQDAPAAPLLELPASLRKVCGSMPYGAAAGRVPVTVDGLEAWLTGLRSVLAVAALESEQTGAALRELEQQRAAVRAFLGTES